MRRVARRVGGSGGGRGGASSGAGQQDQSVTLNGTDEFAASDDGSQFDWHTTDSFSLMAWIKTTDTSVRHIVAKFDNTTGYVLRVNGANAVSFLFRAGGALTRKEVSAPDATDGEWFHVAVTYDGSNTSAGINLYGNGALLDTITFEQELASGTGATAAALAVGAARPAAPFGTFLGQLDQAAVYDVELSAAQIATIYNNGNISDQPDAYAWWKIGEGDTGPEEFSDTNSGGYILETTGIDSSNFTEDVPGA